MNKLRDQTGVVLWILVIAFGVIWVLQDAGTFDVVGATGTTIIEVDGDVITYDEYAGALEQQMEAYRQQYGEAMPPQMVDLTRDRVFDALVEDRLREREINRLGISVTDQEVVDLIQGDDPHQLIRLYFGDGQGGVDRALLQNFIENPDAKDQLVQLESYLRAERRREKLDNLIASTVRVSDQDVLDEYDRRNRRVSARYVALRYASLPDDSITVEERDLRQYYDRHREDYRRERSYALSYVTASKLPSAADTAIVMEDLRELTDEFRTTDSDSLFLARNASERPYTSAYFRRDELDPALADAVFANLEEGRLVGPVVSGNEAHLIKITGVRAADEPAVQARHILIRAQEGQDEARREARRTLEDAMRRIRGGEDFGDVARELSQDPGSARRGGDLGWFGPGRMVEAFEDAAMGARVGQVVGPFETQFGVHILQVTDRADRAVQLADYAQPIRASIGTLSDTQERLEDLKYFTEEGGAFEEEAQRLGFQVQTVRVEADQQVVPGIGRSAALTNWLEDAEEDEVSRVIELDEQFVVAKLDEVTPEGYRPFAEVKAELEPRVKIEKKREVLAARMRRALEQGGFDGLAEALGTGVRTADNLAFNSPVVAGLGRSPQFVGTALGLSEGATSGVIEGDNAVFVLQVADVQEPAPITEAQREQLRQQLLQQRRNLAVNEWLTALRDQADVQDNRRRFFQ